MKGSHARRFGVVPLIPFRLRAHQRDRHLTKDLARGEPDRPFRVFLHRLPAASRAYPRPEERPMLIRKLTLAGIAGLALTTAPAFAQSRM